MHKAAGKRIVAYVVQRLSMRGADIARCRWVVWEIPALR
jgi:hypothetical protein